MKKEHARAVAVSKLPSLILFALQDRRTMYETYWRLTQKPFENAADPRFYYPAESHQAALLKLRYAIENRRGAALLAGPSGSGKTL